MPMRQIGQCFDNLCNNSFSENGDDITITMEAQSNKLQITFEYDGEIPEKIPGCSRRVDIPQKADAIGNINWPVLSELMMSA